MANKMRDTSLKIAKSEPASKFIQVYKKLNKSVGLFKRYECLKNILDRFRRPPGTATINSRPQFSLKRVNTNIHEIDNY